MSDVSSWLNIENVDKQSKKLRLKQARAYGAILKGEGQPLDKVFSPSNVPTVALFVVM